MVNYRRQKRQSLFAVHSFRQRIKTARGLASQIHYSLALDGTDVKMREATASMTGKSSGALIDIHQAKEFANLVLLSGVNAAFFNNAALSLFGIVHRILALLSSSITLWEILMNTLQISLRGHSEHTLVF
jgi:hypothetical protein